jgi:YHS domain-containing protein
VPSWVWNHVCITIQLKNAIACYASETPNAKENPRKMTKKKRGSKKPQEERTTMTKHKTCQVCAKPIAEQEMCFEKQYKGKTYFACCPVCFSMLQEEPEKHIETWLDAAMRRKVHE